MFYSKCVAFAFGFYEQTLKGCNWNMVGVTDISNRLLISTIAEDAAEIAREYGLGLEVAEFCTAYNMDIDFSMWDNAVRKKMAGVTRFAFHAPFNELCPAAVDPMIAEVAKKRYAQAAAIMDGYGINAMVVHSGYMQELYHKSWFVEKSVAFWTEFLSERPEGFRLYLENVFERTPDLLIDIVAAVNDKRFRLCLDVGHAANRGIEAVGVEYAGAEEAGAGAAGTGDAGAYGWMLRMLPFLNHVHLHNNDGKRDTHYALGDGIIDMAAFISGTAAAAPGATFTIETSHGKTSVEWLIANGFIPAPAFS